MAKTRRYSIEIKDPDNRPVLFAALDWTDDERLIAVAQIMRLAGLPDDCFTAPATEPKRAVAKPDTTARRRLDRLCSMVAGAR
jgi:hypothetical protein